MLHTDTSGPRLLARVDLDAAELWHRHPPRLADANKRLVLEIAGAAGRSPSGTLTVTRYAPGPLPSTVGSGRPQLRSESGVFEYPTPAAGATEWHVNFADPHLFFAYGRAAFAQDEIQVAEHPILGSLLEALRAESRPGLPPLTEEAGVPTPVLVRGAERWCAIDTDPDLAMPYGIYGRRFTQAAPAVIRQAVTRVELEHRTNLIAMAAPMGTGRYTREQIQLILDTAFTGFTAARLESEGSVIVHTGHWGTGAFGGNRVLMALVQLLAAQLAELDVLVYHSVGGDGVDAYEEGARLATRLLTPSAHVADVVSSVAALGFTWGISDGN